MHEENRVPAMNLIHRPELQKELKSSNFDSYTKPPSTHFPFASKLDSIDSKYRYHEKKSEFDTPKITSRVRPFHKNPTGLTPIPIMRKDQRDYSSQISPLLALNGNNVEHTAATQRTLNPYASLTKPDTLPPFQLSFLKKPEEKHENFLNSKMLNKVDIINGLRNTHKSLPIEISEYENRIGQKVNRRVALTVLPLFCIVFVVSILLDFISGYLFRKESKFSSIF